MVMVTMVMVAVVLSTRFVIVIVVVVMMIMAVTVIVMVVVTVIVPTLCPLPLRHHPVDPVAVVIDHINLRGGYRVTDHRLSSKRCPLRDEPQTPDAVEDVCERGTGIDQCGQRHVAADSGEGMKLYELRHD